jgi:hypothetical protein
MAIRLVLWEFFEGTGILFLVEAGGGGGGGADPTTSW